MYDNSEFDAYYCPELVKKFYTCIDTATIDLDHHQFIVHFDTGDIMVTVDMIEDYTKVPSSPQHNETLPLIDYMTIMDARCVEQDRGFKASTTFHNFHCFGRWVFDYTTSFNKPVLQIIHSLMIMQHTVCLNTVLLQSLVTNFQRTRGANYSLPVLVTRLCRNFLSEEVFSAFDLAKSSSEEQLKEDELSHHPLIHVSSCLPFGKA